MAKLTRKEKEKARMREWRTSYVESCIRDAKKHGTYIGPRQLYSETGLKSLCTRIDVQTRYAKKYAREVFTDCEKIFGLDKRVRKDFFSGQIDISYIDSNENGHISKRTVTRCLSFAIT